MAKINSNYQKLAAGYLFPEIGRRVSAFTAANPDAAPFFARHVPFPHSVVTAHLIDQAGQPTIAARNEILAYFTQRLTSATPPAAAPRRTPAHGR